MKTFDSIESITDERTDWNLRVRVIRIWDIYSSKASKEFKGKNLLLLDDKHVRIHAFIWPNNIQAIKCDIEEGKIYTIQNVQLKYYRDEAIKCIQYDKQLWFLHKTKMEILGNYEHMIPNNAFDFYNFRDIKNLPKTLPKTQLIDVVGILLHSDYNCRKIINSNDVEQTQLRFTLTDGRYTASFCFWDAFALSFDEHFKKQTNKPVIVIVSSCRYNIFKEEVSLSNLGPTKFYMNYDHHSVDELRDRYNKGLFKIELPIEEETELEISQIFTLANLQKLQNDSIGKSVMCNITISTVEEKSNWWCYVCTKCHDRVKIVEDEYECAVCNRIIPYPQKSFTLCVNVEDDNGAAAILLDDREAQRMIGKNVYEVLRLHKEESIDAGLPSIIKSIEGKQYTFTVEVSESNIKQRSCMYNAVDVFEGHELVGNSEVQEPSTMMTSDTLQEISGKQTISIESFETPGTHTSTSKRKHDKVELGEIPSFDIGFEILNNDTKVAENINKDTKVVLKSVKLEPTK